MAEGGSASGGWNDPGSSVRRFALHLVREKYRDLDLRLRRGGPGTAMLAMDNRPSDQPF
jgi:hypothetical protein